MSDNEMLFIAADSKRVGLEAVARDVFEALGITEFEERFSSAQTGARNRCHPNVSAAPQPPDQLHTQPRHIANQHWHSWKQSESSGLHPALHASYSSRQMSSVFSEAGKGVKPLE